LVAEKCRTVMHKVNYAPEKLADNFDRFVFHQDWPASSPVIYAQQQVFAEARAAGFKVLLSGQGPDEYLDGYPYHIALRAMAAVRSGALVDAVRLVLEARNRAPLTRTHIARLVARDARSVIRGKLLPRRGTPPESAD